MNQHQTTNKTIKPGALTKSVVLTKPGVLAFQPERLAFIVFGILFIFTTILSTILISTYTFADNPVTVSTTSSANASVTVPSACTLSGGNNTFSANVQNGSTVETSDTTTFGSTTPIKAVCNDPNGFSIYAIGYSGNSYTASNHTKMIASAGADYDIDTATNNGTSTGGSNGNSYWAMKLTAVTGTGQDYPAIIAGSSTDPNKQAGDTDYSDYATIPANFTKVAYRATQTDIGSNPTGSSITPTYKVYINGSQPAGTYTGKVKYTLVHPNTMVAGTYTIAFNANGGTGTMANQTTSTTGGSLYNFEDQTLNALSTGTITPPSHYQFAGWCTVQDQNALGANPSATPGSPNSLPQTTCEGSSGSTPAVSYPDQGTVLASTTAASSTLSLYAYYNLASYTITLDQNGATTSSSPTTATVTYGDTNLSSLTTNPTKEHPITGFTTPTSNGAEGAIVTFPEEGNCTAANDCIATYTFTGWYKEAATTNRIADNSLTPVLDASTDYTDLNSKWNYDGNQPITFYAGWSATSTMSTRSLSNPSANLTLPTITKTGYNCGWTETATDATELQYASGETITPTSDLTLYGVCTIKNNLSLTVSFDSNVESIAVRYGAIDGTLIDTVTTSGTTITDLIYNANYYLIPTYADNYKLSAWSQDQDTVNYPNALSSTSTENPYYTIGDGDNGVTLASEVNAHTCTKQYRLQNADGTYPSNYTADGTEQIPHGETCAYTKSVSNYTTKSGTKENMTEDQTISLDLPRTTYTLTVSAGSNTSSATGGGTYRWGQTVTVGVTKASDSTGCKNYDTPSWEQTSGSAGTLDSTSGDSVSFTMGTSDATVTATSTAKSVQSQIKIEVYRSSGSSVSSTFTVDGRSYTTSSTTIGIYCGTHTLTANQKVNSKYLFQRWSTNYSGMTLTNATNYSNTTMNITEKINPISGKVTLVYK